MEKEGVINNPIGFHIPIGDNSRDIIHETNFIDAENPPGSGGGNQNDPNDPGENPEDNIYPAGHDPMTNEQIVNNQLLSQREHAEFLKSIWGQTMVEKKSLYAIGAAAVAYILFS
jgi:hypothetical protein